MKPPPFDYYAPTSVEEALDLLAQHGDDAKPLAGGQSLVAAMKMRLAQPGTLVDLSGIAELRGIRREGDNVVIGAKMCLSDVVHVPAIVSFAVTAGILLITIVASVVPRKAESRAVDV